MNAVAEIPATEVDRRPRGRPLLYTQKLAAEICERFEAGESLLSICRSEHMPSAGAVRAWAEKDINGFAAEYAYARNKGLDHMADQVIAIADDGTLDTIEDADGNLLTDHEHINRSRLRVDTRKWYLSKLAPKRYGEKLSMELTGADGGPIEISEPERMQRAKQLLTGVKALLAGTELV